jgi:hypothetical protein
MTFVYYDVSCVSSILLLLTEPRPSGLKKSIYNPFCDADEEVIIDMLNEELDSDSDYMDLEIEEEPMCEESCNKMLESESETSVVAC